MNCDFTKYSGEAGANALDQIDCLRGFPAKFSRPTNSDGKNLLYFAGHSLGLMPLKAKEYVVEEMDAWGRFGVAGHFSGSHPWLSYHELIAQSFANIVGAKPSEVVACNSLTTNLHLAMVSFYRPYKNRRKILIEENTFPSDKYAVDSQVRFHGFIPNQEVIEVPTSEKSLNSDPDKILELVETHKSDLALILLGECNYLTGQSFGIEKIVEAAKKYGIKVGFNLAHGAGNLSLKLHDWDVDFAVWCTYKYLNSGPGGIAGLFIHEKHHGMKDIPRFEGWWGHNKKTRFEMGSDFDPIETVEAWQLSNPPILPLASLRSSMDIFNEAGMDRIAEKRDKITGYLEFLIRKDHEEKMTIVTPEERGSMLCVQLRSDKSKQIVQMLEEKGAFLDFRMPNIVRLAPTPLTTTFRDVYDLNQLFCEVL
ncbi:kynureninase [Bacteriovoracaceae bacterium]|nr:kynureninase [Bacteriovoracaceae bacterium]